MLAKFRKSGQNPRLVPTWLIFHPVRILNSNPFMAWMSIILFFPAVQMIATQKVYKIQDRKALLFIRRAISFHGWLPPNDSFVSSSCRDDQIKAIFTDHWARWWWWWWLPTDQPKIWIGIKQRHYRVELSNRVQFFIVDNNIT